MAVQPINTLKGYFEAAKRPTQSQFEDLIDSTYGVGDVAGPGSSTDNAIPRFDGTGGKTLQDSGVTIDDSDNMTVPGTLGVTGAQTNSAIVKWSKGADVASANALTLGTDGNYFDITGTTAITSIGTLGVGTVVKLHFDGALTLTHHATDLILPGGANITTAAGDEAEFVEYASGDWRCTYYTRADGTAVVGNDVQTFASSGTWTKPSRGTIALIECWGAGASGGKGSSGAGCGGGGGGAYSRRTMLLSALGSTETVTIGAGGAAQTTADSSGLTGGNTTFGSHVTANGGGPGSGSAASGGGGGGGSAFNAGGAAGNPGGAGGGPLGGSGGSDGGGAGGDGSFGGGGGGGRSISGTAAGAGGASGEGGGGGGGGNFSTGNGGAGGNSYYGGAGGGGSAGGAGTAGSGGTSRAGGNGGAAAKDANNATAGSVPGGGGGGSETGTSGAGGNGMCRVTVF